MHATLTAIRTTIATAALLLAPAAHAGGPPPAAPPAPRCARAVMVQPDGTIRIRTVCVLERGTP